MKLLGLALPVVGFFGAYIPSRKFMKGRPDLAILLSPALLIVIWTFVISGIVQAGIPLSAAWQYFWATTAVASFFGCCIAFRDRHPDDILTILLTPLLATSVVMAPYLYHGLASFPGSKFWDGFAYMAMGESLWLHPRHETAAGLELFYQLGHHFAHNRYISAALISMLKGIFPFGGDAQSATGYFLFLSIFTFSSSCFFLAKVTMPNHRMMQIVFVTLATVSGHLLNLVWANNFDHLLAMSIAPIIIALAFILRWGSITDAVLFAMFAAAEVYIYAEMAALFVMPAALILLVRLFQDEKSLAQIKSAAVAIVVLLVLLFPAWPELSAFFQNQIRAVAVAPSEAARPGNGYFPTFFAIVCGPGAWFGLFSPGSQCWFDFASIIKFFVGLGCAAVVILSFLAWRRSLALLVSVVLSGAAASYFLLAKHYDYGAFKILVTALVPMLLVCTLGTLDLSIRLRRAAATVAIAVLIVAVTQVARFERSVPIKSISRYADLYNAIPRSGIVNVRIADQLSFEWAVYYLRDHRAVYTKGELLYYPASEVDKSSEKSRVAAAEYLVTDSKEEAPAIWSNGTFHLYPLKEPCGHAPCIKLSDDRNE
jgi:hypothetical protein